MKRMIIRLSALTAVISLGTFAVVEAERSARSAAEEAASSGEPAPLDVDERTVKPLPPPTDRYADDDRYAPTDRLAQADAARAETAATPARDPFAAAQIASHTRDLPDDPNTPPTPLPEDPQGIPHAAEAMRRYGGNATSRQAMRPRGDIRPLGYEDATAPTAAQSPDDVAADGGTAGSGGQPTLAPPRPGDDRYAPPDVDLPADGTSGQLVPEADDAAPVRQQPRSSRRRPIRSVALACRRRRDASRACCRPTHSTTGNRCRRPQTISRHRRTSTGPTSPPKGSAVPAASISMVRRRRR